jgi:hypothetical protein
MVHEVIDRLKQEFLNEPFCNTATDGDIFDVDLNKITIFPLTHVMCTGFQDLGSTVSFSFSVLCMDIIDETKKNESNKNSIWNAQSALILRVMSSIRRGKLRSENWQLQDVQTAVFFTERFENNLAGVEQSFTVLVPNTMTIC